MAAIVNERDVLLQATTPRMLLVASNFITVTSTTNTFNTTATTISPANILVRANLSGELNGTVTWTVSPVVPVTITGNVVSIPSTSVAPGTSVTLTATLTLYGQTYTASTIVGNIAETVTSGLSTNAVTISTNTDGTGGVYTSATSTMTVSIGTVDNSSAWAFNWTVPAGVTATGQNTRTITVSNMTVDDASLTCEATRTGWPTQTRTFTISKSKAGTPGVPGTPGTPGTPGVAGASLDFSGTTTFYKNSGGLITPGTATLTAIALNTTSPSFSWSVSGATPTSGTGTSITITPTGLSLAITVSLTITAANLPAPVVITKTMGIVEQGAPGQVGQNGTMSAFPSIFQWTSGSEPARPSTTSTYTWATGTWTAPSGWTTQPTSNTSPGWVLWEITVPLNVEATTTQSTLNWASTSFPIRAATANGTNGTPGTPGSPGDPGTPGTNGSATYLIDRGSVNSSSAPTSSEVFAATGFRFAQLGDIATIRFNSGNNSTAYRATSSGSGASWALQATYITGSLIVAGSISAEKLSAGTFTSDGNLFRTTLGTTTFVDGIGVTYLLGYYGRRTESAGVGTGPTMGIDDVSNDPGTYNFYAMSAKGGAAKFQAQAGNGSNIVMISGNKPDGLVIHPENGSPSANGVHISNTNSPVGFKVTKTTGTLLQQNAFNAEGNFYSVTTGSGAGLFINNTYASANGFGAIIRTASSAPAIQCENYGGGAGLYSIGAIYSSSDVVAFFSSDINLKTNIVKIPNALEKLKQLGGYTYDWKDEVLAKKGGEDGYFVRKQDVGIIAQEVQKVLPEIVATRPDGTLGVRYERLIALVIEAIKELDGKIK